MTRILEVTRIYGRRALPRQPYNIDAAAVAATTATAAELWTVLLVPQSLRSPVSRLGSALDLALRVITGGLLRTSPRTIIGIWSERPEASADDCPR